MTTIDLVILVILLWGAIIGFIKGFVIQSLTLVALVLGVWAGMHFSYKVTDFLYSHFSMNGKYVPILSFTIIFIMVLIMIHFIGKLLTSLLNESILGKFNRIGGIVFGVLKMAFILSICIVILGKLDAKHKLITNSEANKSFFYKPIERIAPAIFPHLHFKEIKKSLLNG